MSAPPAGTKVFIKTSVINTTLTRIMIFHEDPKALAKLTPPPIFAQLLRDERRSLTDGEVAFRLWIGPLPIAWTASHKPGPAPHSFADLQIEGPLAYWRHEHIFKEIPGGVELTDRITLAHKQGLPGLFTRLFFDGLPLRILFAYRHLRTRWETQLR